MVDHSYSQIQDKWHSVLVQYRTQHFVLQYRTIPYFTGQVFTPTETCEVFVDSIDPVVVLILLGTSGAAQFARLHLTAIDSLSMPPSLFKPLSCHWHCSVGHLAILLYAIAVHGFYIRNFNSSLSLWSCIPLHSRIIQFYIPILLSVGRNYSSHDYCLNDTPLNRSMCSRDMGVLVSSDFCWRAECIQARGVFSISFKKIQILKAEIQGAFLQWEAFCCTSFDNLFIYGTMIYLYLYKSLLRNMPESYYSICTFDHSYPVLPIWLEVLLQKYFDLQHQAVHSRSNRRFGISLDSEASEKKITICLIS